MASFIVRVELVNIAHGHPSYTQLHTAMGQQGFLRIITDSNGGRWELPPAEYHLNDATSSAALALAKAQTAAASIGHPQARVLVSGAPQTWSNLQKVRV